LETSVTSEELALLKSTFKQNPLIKIELAQGYFQVLIQVGLRLCSRL